jgi:hypothetical protein
LSLVEPLGENSGAAQKHDLMTRQNPSHSYLQLEIKPSMSPTALMNFFLQISTVSSISHSDLRGSIYSFVFSQSFDYYLLDKGKAIALLHYYSHRVCSFIGIDFISSRLGLTELSLQPRPRPATYCQSLHRAGNCQLALRYSSFHNQFLRNPP